MTAMNVSESSGQMEGGFALFRYYRDEKRLEWQSESSLASSIDLFNIIQDDHSEDPSGPYLILGLEDVVPEPEPGGLTQKLRCFMGWSLPEEALEDFLLDSLPQHLFKPTATNVHVIVSTLSGTGLAQSYFTNIIKPFFYAIGLYAFEIHETQSADHISKLARDVFCLRARKGIQQTIILLSGDGGLADLVNVFLSTNLGPKYVKPTIIMVPVGTGNAFSSSLGLTKTNTSALHNILWGYPQDIPLFTVNISPGALYVVDEGRQTQEIEPPGDSLDGSLEVFGVVVCSWGFHASLVANSDTMNYRKYGNERFQMAAKELLWPQDKKPSHSYMGRISIIPAGHGSYQTLGEKEHMYVLTTMVSNLERTFVISPNSKPLDGQLRIVHFGPLDSEEVMKIMDLAYQNGKHVEEKAVNYIDVDAVRVEFDEAEAQWRRICVDGKIIIVPKNGWIEIRKEERMVLQVVAPAL